VSSFIFADRIVLPILNIYRKYYGMKMTRYLLLTFYAAMVAAGLVVEVLFTALELVPDERNAKVVDASVTWNYTTVLNIVFLVLAGVLVIRAVAIGVARMLRMMDEPPDVDVELEAAPAMGASRRLDTCVRCIPRCELHHPGAVRSAGCNSWSSDVTRRIFA
jgi:hypothetical protein